MMAVMGDFKDWRLPDVEEAIPFSKAALRAELGLRGWNWTKSFFAGSRNVVWYVSFNGGFGNYAGIDDADDFLGCKVRVVRREAPADESCPDADRFDLNEETVFDRRSGLMWSRSELGEDGTWCACHALVSSLNEAASRVSAGEG